jgi:aminoglycoside phosphotransferase (APT) family kinase protein
MPEQVVTKRRDADEMARALEPWLSQQLAGQQLDGLHVAAPSGHGFSNDTVMADAIVDGAPLPLVVQAAPTGPGLFPEYPIGRMAAVQRDLRDHSDVPVANVLWFEDDSAILGAPFYVMDRIDGFVPDESPAPYHCSGWVFDATVEQRRRMWLSMLDAMGRLHRVDVAGHFPYLTTTRWGMPLDADPAAERVRQWRDFTVWASEGGDPPRPLMDAWDALAKTLPPRPGKLSICWGDAKLGNILFRDFDVAALLDWELCGVSAAEEDLTGQLAVDAVLASVAPTSRIDGFLTHDETITGYQKILQRELVGTDWWYVFALAKMGAEIHRLLLRSQQLGAIPAGVDIEAVNVAIPILGEELGRL